MTFPTTILERVVQAFIDGAWVDISSYVYHRDGILITRGGGSEQSTTQPVKCDLSLDDRDERFSPRNPDGPYFGLIGRNLLLSTSVRLGERFLLLGGSVANYLTTPDSTGTSVTGDIDVRADVTLVSWRKLTGLAGKYSAGQQSWYLRVSASGKLNLGWSTDGTNDFQASSTVPIPWPQANRATVRATLDVNNGAGGYTVTFYYSTTRGVAGPWTQLGDPVVTTAGTTSIFNSTTATTFGALQAGSTQIGEGRLHGGEVRSGIGGTVVASPTLAAQTAGASSFSDGTNTWTVAGTGASITNFRTEFVGEIPDLSVKRERSGNDVWVPVSASGITRRLGQGQSPVQSTLRRAIPAIGSALRAYWPLEDGANASFGAAGIPGVGPMRYGAAPEFASSDVFVGSAPLPLMQTARLRGIVPGYTSTGVVQARFVMQIPAAGAANGAILCRLNTGGTLAQWDLIYTTGGNLTLTAYNSSGTSIGSLGPVAYAVDGELLFVSIELSQSGGNVSATVSTVAAGESVGGTSSTSIAGTVTTCRVVTLNANGLLTDTTMGHVTVENAITTLFALGRPLAGWAGETAGRRVERLCSEAGITFLARGDLDDSAAMGPQGRATLLALMRECEATDGGILSEPRDRLGITYRPLSAAYSPGVALTLDGGGGSGGDLSDYDTTDDDQLTRNDITASRSGGSSYRVVDTDGPLGTDTVGTYDDAPTVNVERDEDLPDQASWRLNLGTIDETRFPLVEVELGRAALVADTATTTAVLDADLGDGLDLTDPPATLPRTDVREVIVSRVVALGSHTYTARWVCQPAAGFDVAIYDYEHPDEPSRYSTEGSTVNGAHADPADTTISVATPVGSVWGHGDGDFTIRIPETGERMLVTGITGTTSPQTFDVDRGVDGTTAKALAGGETVELARPVRWGR